jgi:hypothetical protein
VGTSGGRGCVALLPSHALKDRKKNASGERHPKLCHRWPARKFRRLPTQALSGTLGRDQRHQHMPVFECRQVFFDDLPCLPFLPRDLIEPWVAFHADTMQLNAVAVGDRRLLPSEDGDGDDHGCGARMIAGGRLNRAVVLATGPGTVPIMLGHPGPRPFADTPCPGRPVPKRAGLER